MTKAYLYKWVHKPTLNWYVGSRTKKNCHPSDGYICSSKIVKPMIMQSPNEWERFIIDIGDVDYIRKLEAEILTAADAANDQRSFNKHNQNGKFFCFGHSEETKQKIIKSHAFAGKKRPDHSKKMTGKTRKPEHVEKWRIKLLGVKKSKEHIAKLKQVKSKGCYITPLGSFPSSRDAAEAHGCAKGTILARCRGHLSFDKKKWIEPVEGWKFEPRSSQ